MQTINIVTVYILFLDMQTYHTFSNLSDERSWCMAMTRAWYYLLMLLASRWELVAVLLKLKIKHHKQFLVARHVN